MTCAAMEAQALDELLARRRRGNLDGLAREFFTQAAKIVDNPWQMAVGADFRFPGTVGKKAASVDFVNAYVARVHRATHHDPLVLKEFLKVMNLMQPPASLFHPRVMLRVLSSGRKSEEHVRWETVEVRGGEMALAFTETAIPTYVSGAES
jgi:hypothetical protein